MLLFKYLARSCTIKTSAVLGHHCFYRAGESARLSWRGSLEEPNVKSLCKSQNSFCSRKLFLWIYLVTNHLTSSLHMAGIRCRTMNVLLNVWRQCLTLLERCLTSLGQTDPRHCHHPCLPAQGFQCWSMPMASEDSSTALSSCPCHPGRVPLSPGAPGHACGAPAPSLPLLGR